MTSAENLGAWLLPVTDTAVVAVGRYELKYIEYISSSIRLPGLPDYCAQGFIWRDRFVPAVDLQQLALPNEPIISNTERLAAIIAYENSDGSLATGAIYLRGVPRLLQIKPEQSLSINQLETSWQLIAHAAFQAQDRIYPVLDLRALFDSTPADLNALH